MQDKPYVRWVKLNMGWYNKGNSGNIRGGGIIRDHNGVFLCAFAYYDGSCSNNLAEAKVMQKGILLCIIKGLPTSLWNLI